jgi:hypothetical protein
MLYLAAILLFLLGLAHSLLGERYILMRLFRQNGLPKLFGGTRFTRRTLRFAWHLTTVAWWGLAALLGLLAQNRLGPNSDFQNSVFQNSALSNNSLEGSVLTVIGWTMLLSGLLPLFLTRGRHLSWVVLLLVGALALVAVER